MLRRVVRAIALMMEAARTFETSVNVYQTTRRNIPDLHSRRRENIKNIPKLIISN
jgi:hypothetical protein